ncbi:MAG TPA: redoxin domain-containing protein [Chloroflexia bacterium]|nr:redoxin domain-containing protein [Chloroflexia bacterium]
MRTETDYGALDVAPERPANTWLPMVGAMAGGLIIIVLIGAVVLLTAPPPVTPVNLPAEGVRVGATAPDFTLKQLNGGEIKLSSYRGVKPVWINFWATWCPHCKVEMPQMQQLYTQYQAQGLEILGVDDQEPGVVVAPFFKNGGYTWPVALDERGTVSRQYRVSGLPTHIFVGKEGIIKRIVVGSIERPAMEQGLALIMGTQ